MHSHGAGGGAFAGGINCVPKISCTPRNRIFLLSGQAAPYDGGGTIHADGDLVVTNRSEFTAQDLYGLVDFGGFGTGTGIEASLQTTATNLTVLGKSSKLTSDRNITIFSHALTSANNIQTSTHNGAAAGAAVAWFRWTGGDHQDLIFGDNSTTYAKNNLHAQIWTGKRGLAVTRATMGAGASRTEAHTIVQDAGGYSRITLAGGSRLRADNLAILYNLYNPFCTTEAHATAGGAMLFGIGEAIAEFHPQLVIRLSDNARLEGNRVVMRATLNDRWGSAQQNPTLNVTGDYTGTTGPSPFCFGNGKAEAKLLGQWIISMAPSSTVQYASTLDFGVGGFAPSLNAWQEKIWNGVHYGSHGLANFKNGTAVSPNPRLIHSPLSSVQAASVNASTSLEAGPTTDPFATDVLPESAAFPEDVSRLEDLAAIYEYYQDHPDWVAPGLRTILAELLQAAQLSMSEADIAQWRYEMAALLASLVPDHERLALEQSSPIADGASPILQSLAKTLNDMVEDPRHLDPRVPEGVLLWGALYDLLRLDPHRDPVVADEIRDMVWLFEVFYGPAAKNTIVIPPQTGQFRHLHHPEQKRSLIRVIREEERHGPLTIRGSKPTNDSRDTLSRLERSRRSDSRS